MTEEEFAAFVAAAPWTFATTMPEQPHEYTLRKEHDPATFEAAVAFIREHGDRRRWGRHTHTYYDLDGRTYWTLGWPVEQTVVLNRADLQEHR
jgi:hypothetical protein